MKRDVVDFERARILRTLRRVLERLDVDDLLRLLQIAARLKDAA